MKKVIIIGGGASGLVAAIMAARNKNNQVIILEQNSNCCKKLLQTGNGRCNYFNENQDLSNYHSSTPQLVKEFITEENLEKVLSFFKEIGIVPKIKNGYYYPLSNQASSMKKLLLKKAHEMGVNIITDFTVSDLQKENSKWIINRSEDHLVADQVVMSMGSYASLKLENECNGYSLLQKLGHKIVKVLPSLVQLRGNESYFKRWSGVRCDAKLTVKEDDELIKIESGEIQLTDYGISGICTFNISGFVSRGLEQHKKEIVEIDFLPSISKDIEEFVNYLKKRSKMVLGSSKEFLVGLLNDKLIDVILEVANIDPNSRVVNLTEEQFRNLAIHIKSFSLNIIGTNSYDKAQVCSGGLSLDEINIKTMESKLEKNLYIVGELLDLDGLCGGYNLTIAWISGILAGSDISA